MDELPLLELFTRLREAGLPLGISDYEAVLRAVQKGYGLPDRAALARLCQTLWVRSPDEQRLLNYYLEQLIQPDKVGNEVTKDDSQQRLNRVRALYVLLKGSLIVCFIVIVGVVLWYNPSNKLVWVLSLLLASGGVAFLQFRNLSFLGSLVGDLWKLRHSNKLRWQEQERSAGPVAPSNSAKLASELIRETDDIVQVAQAVQQITSKQINLSRDRFILRSDYLPVTQRQMKQSWRHLRRMVREGSATELDMEGTVQRIAREGMLLNPILIPQRTNRAELVLLIDQDGSMVPFHSLSTRLVDTALRGGRLGKVGSYYFHNCPDRYLYRDPMHQDGEPIKEVLRGFQYDRTSILIFSDAGAARGGLSWERAELTATFLHQLKAHVRYVAWLNPMPQSRWATSTAGEIALQVPMFEVSQQGLDAAISILRGHHQTLAK